MRIVVDRSRRRWRALASTLLLAVAACRVREAPEDARAKAQKRFLQEQVASLQELVARAERGELATADRIAIGVHENVVEASWHALVDSLAYGLRRASVPA